MDNQIHSNPLNEQQIYCAFQDLKNLLLEQKAILDILLPNEISMRTLTSTTGKKRQTLRAYILNNFEPEVDYNIKNATIVVSKDAYVKILGFYNAKRRL